MACNLWHVIRAKTKKRLHCVYILILLYFFNFFIFIQG